MSESASSVGANSLQARLADQGTMSNPSEAYVALGSNIEPQRHLSQAARALKRRFAPVRFSPCYRNRAYGFEGPDFINAVAVFPTDLPIESLLASLREVEAESGRKAADPKWGSRAIDLDLL